MAPHALPSVLLWGSAQAGTSLTLAATAWLVSGLTGSPLLNSLLPALAALPALLPLRRRSGGYGLQIAAVLLLLAVGLFQLHPDPVAPEPLLIASLAAVLLFALGQEISQLPLQRWLLGRGLTTVRGLRRGADLGGLLGTVLTALLFPAVLQFGPALLLLLPLGVAAPGRPLRESVAVDPQGRPGRLAIPLDPRCALQGLLFGGLFALLPLWVRTVGGGVCFDFAMVLAAYGLGRGFSGWMPLLPGPLRYGLMAVLLGLSQLTPAWGAVLLFLPIGALAAASDAALVEAIAPLGDGPLRWQVLQRSSTVGGLAGSVGMGLLSQLLGLTRVLPLQIMGFLVFALVLGRGSSPSPSR